MLNKKLTNKISDFKKQINIKDQSIQELKIVEKNLNKEMNE